MASPNDSDATTYTYIPPAVPVPGFPLSEKTHREAIEAAANCYLPPATFYPLGKGSTIAPGAIITGSLPSKGDSKTCALSEIRRVITEHKESVPHGNALDVLLDDVAAQGHANVAKGQKKLHVWIPIA